MHHISRDIERTAVCLGIIEWTLDRFFIEPKLFALTVPRIRLALFAYRIWRMHEILICEFNGWLHASISLLAKIRSLKSTKGLNDRRFFEFISDKDKKTACIHWRYMLRMQIILTPIFCCCCLRFFLRSIARYRAYALDKSARNTRNFKGSTNVMLKLPLKQPTFVGLRETETSMNLKITNLHK